MMQYNPSLTNWTSPNAPRPMILTTSKSLAVSRFDTMVLIEGSSAGGGCRVWRGGEGRGKGICTCVEGEGGNRCVWRGRVRKINYCHICWWFPVISAETIQLPLVTLYIHTTMLVTTATRVCYTLHLSCKMVCIIKNIPSDSTLKANEHQHENKLCATHTL